MKQFHAERGVVIIFFALFLLVIAAFLALSIDSYRLVASDTQQHATAELAALAALRTYRTTSVDPAASPLDQHKQRLAAALARAERVAGFPTNVLLGRLDTNQAAPGEFLEGTGAITGTSDSAGSVLAGKWYDAEPLGSCTAWVAQGGDPAASCPCPSGSWGGTPCFAPNTSTDTKLNAFQVTLHTKSNFPLKNVFGAVIGQGQLPIGNVARAAIVPQHGIFAIDLSRSLGWQTHLNFFVLPSANQFQASEYVFELDAAAGSICPGNNAIACQDPAAPCQFRGGAAAGQIFYTSMLGARPAAQSHTRFATPESSAAFSGRGRYFGLNVTPAAAHSNLRFSMQSTKSIK